MNHRCKSMTTAFFNSLLKDSLALDFTARRSIGDVEKKDAGDEISLISRPPLERAWLSTGTGRSGPELTGDLT